MSTLLRRLRLAFQADESNRHIRKNCLVAEALEPRILLSSDPIYSYADPEGVAAWYKTAVVGPALVSLGEDLAQVTESFAGGGLFGSAYIKAQINVIEPYVDYLINNLSYYQYNEWDTASSLIPYYTYDSSYVDQYFEIAISEPIARFLGDRYSGSDESSFAGTFTVATSVTEYINSNLDIENVSWQYWTSNALPHSLPDLQVVSVQAPTTADEGSRVSVSATIRNSSDNSAGAFECQYFVSPTGNISSSVSLGDPFVISGLTKGNSITDSRSLSLPYNVVGDYYVGLYVNVGATVPEDNTSNNLAVTNNPMLIMRL